MSFLLCLTKCVTGKKAVFLHFIPNCWHRYEVHYSFTDLLMANPNFELQPLNNNVLLNRPKSHLLKAPVDNFRIIAHAANKTI